MDPISAYKMMVSSGAGGLPGNPVQDAVARAIPPAELDKLNPPITLSAPDSAQPAYSFQNLLGNFVQDVNDKQAAAGDAVNGLLSGKKCFPASGHDFHGGSQRFLPAHGRSPQQTPRLLPGAHAHADMKHPLFMITESARNKVQPSPVKNSLRARLPLRHGVGERAGVRWCFLLINFF